MAASTASARIHASLDHPVVDFDGHTVEFVPALLERILAEGVTAEEVFATGLGVPGFDWARLTRQERRDLRVTRTPWWTFPASSSLDRATATLPGLFYERLDEIGLDLAIVYPTIGLFFPHIADPAVRRAACRGLNRYHAEIYGPFADRLRPVAVIPMDSPAEAIEALDHAVVDLGFKAIMVASYVTRPVAAVARRDPESARHATWLDTYFLDSEHDYDPFWARCAELGVAPTSHSVGYGWGTRRSTESYMFNHLGNFAAAGEALCRSLFMAGVTRRFPSLRFAFLEGGVAWGVNLLADLVSHWEKRNAQAVRNYDPANLDPAELRDLFARHGHELTGGAPLDGDVAAAMAMGGAGDTAVDEFAAVAAADPDEVVELFARRFWFGCEADDPLTALGFDGRMTPGGAALNAVLGSDIGHWDVPDVTRVLEEAFEMVEHGWLDAEQFRAFTFSNAVRFFGEVNPSFFDGTVVESAAAEVLGRPVASARRG